MTATRSSLLMELRSENGNAAWSEFLRIYRPLIAGAVRKAGITGQDHDDVVQEVLVQLLKVLPTFSYQKRRGFFRHWLRQVTTNKAIDFHRRRVGQPVPSGELATFSTRESAAAWTREFQLGVLQAAMTSVEPEFRPRTWQCFLLHAIEHGAAHDVASRVGVSINAVYVNTSRVLTRIREFCEFHGEDLIDEGASGLPCDTRLLKSQCSS